MTRYQNLEVGGSTFRTIDLRGEGGDQFVRLPHILRILLENVLRAGGEDSDRGAAAILGWLENARSEEEIPFLPTRVMMHDTTCGPALVDIAGMRSSLSEAGRDPTLLNPVLPVDVSTDHSLAVDVYAEYGALQLNMAREMNRNAERYRFMKWATNTLSNFRVHPPGTGIMHTLNLERLATVVADNVIEGEDWAMPDAMIGTDSHTPMVNGIGVLAWGVGGLEAESVMFGLPIMLRVPDIVGVRLSGKLRPGVTATDLALLVTERLRRVDLADRFVEFFGPGVSNLSAGDRCVVANMTPEFGANSGFFPIDDSTLKYLRETGRSTERVALVEAYAKRQGLWFEPTDEPRFTEVVDIDLGEVEVSLAGPKRPQDRIPASATQAAMIGLYSSQDQLGWEGKLGDGSIAIAAITSCTNTTDPRLLVAAGLLARKARQFGLKPAPHVKTSLAPGSPTAEHYLRRSGLLDDLEAIGFGIVGYGCTTCIGNSGPLPAVILDSMAKDAIVPVAVLSGNRNFPGRIHPQLEAGFLASPPLVIAFALAGDVNRDILSDPVARTPEGRDVFLSDLWPDGAEIDAVLEAAIDADDYARAYGTAEASIAWKELEAPSTALFPWDPKSTYIRRPPFASLGEGTRLGQYLAHPILVLGDDITTDHISPASAILAGSETGNYLVERGENPKDLNVHSSRRGNWESMFRGLFDNKTVRNLLRPTIKPGWTIHAPSGEDMPLWRAATLYRQEGLNVVIVAGERYGMGSSRDWAAKGAALLGARAVLASSFERIHRSNLVNMGILPLRLPVGRGPTALNLAVGDMVLIDAEPACIAPRSSVSVTVVRWTGEVETFEAVAALETSLEVKVLHQGGLLPMILAKFGAVDSTQAQQEAVFP
ncbi:aconitate hydratase AcnA [Neorhizobium sp. T7_12]|uniref:aconitate hydratase AcnA n=1 Tax=Neorhizobium sp. T7_12 TaxID=2093832 RepID=UPI000CF93908|nr:aconitate hydratase AcnA [Neorhizobium sp. T7_12]